MSQWPQCPWCLLYALPRPSQPAPMASWGLPCDQVTEPGDLQTWLMAVVLSVQSPCQRGHRGPPAPLGASLQAVVKGHFPLGRTLGTAPGWALFEVAS